MEGGAVSGGSVWAEFGALNVAYLWELYERYRSDPQAVDPGARELFRRHGAPPSADGNREPQATGDHSPLVAGAVALAKAIRARGHQGARLDPLGMDPRGDIALEAVAHGIDEDELAALPSSIIGEHLSGANALEAIRELRLIYEGTTGYEFEHVSDALERAWLYEAAETGRFGPPKDPIDERKLLERLTEVGSFERFLHLAFPAQTRFSLEGLGMMVPMLDEIIGCAAETGTRTVLLGMAHRGRMNVLAHVLGKPYERIIAEFMGHFPLSNVSSTESTDDGWTGDVKYHMGARRAYPGGAAVDMNVVLAPNPSHLEWVNPVIVGMDRAADERRDAPGRARQNELASMSVLIHGDASFCGQGVVAETLNLSRLPGYRIGGSIHLIANNQLGFTTLPAHSRSTLYSSDLAKGFEIPVIHVNADDPVACIAAARLAHAYREEFRKDVLIDLIGYRRWGHNEGDEPSFTQPWLYRLIRKHPTVRELFAAELARRGILTAEESQRMLQAAVDRLHAIRRSLQQAPPPQLEPTSGLEAGGTAGGLGDPGAATEVVTAIPRETLRALNEELYRVPEGFRIHPKLERPFAARRSSFAQERPVIEWAHAEALAFASIVEEGTPIRLTGQDTGRGTFSQRHAVLYDYETGDRMVPLQRLPQARASFEVWDSPLSEQATLGFEFGYSIQAPDTLVVWEAQYGDFVNVPQAIIDQFIVSARSKWEQRSGLVMLLPHGYEGQGPEHSSARLERFLQMAAEDNVRIANCTTAAQYFHILRRQAQLLRRDPRPLILMTPKSLLRNPLAASPAEILSTGTFRPVLDDEATGRDPMHVRRLVLCSGKVYFDLLAARAESQNGTVAAVRIEELYPFPIDEVAALLQRYALLDEVVWLQEEPRNMGAWLFVAPRLRDLLGERLPLSYIGRTRRASPAEGSHEWHLTDQRRLVEAALSPAPVPIEDSVKREVEHAG